MEGLILDRLTLPEALGHDDDPGATAETLAAAILGPSDLAHVRGR